MTLIGATAGFTPWLPEEDDVLRVGYVRDGARAVSARLGRTLQSVCRRAARIGVASHRRWTATDDHWLETEWGDKSIPDIGKAMGRTAAAIYKRGQELGLGLGCPPGFEYATDAAKRTGYGLDTLRMILRWAKVPVRRSMSRPSKTVRRRPCRIVDSFDVDEAVASWLSTETLQGASDRRGITPVVLVRLLTVFGCAVPEKPTRKRHWRIPSAAIDAAVAAWRRT